MQTLLGYLVIIVRAVASPAIFIIVTLAGALFWLGESVDAVFLLSVITINTLIAIFQEMRAKWSLDRLSIVTREHVRRRQMDGSIEEVAPEQLCEGDTILLHQGDQIQADARLDVGSASLFVNESLLTGESDPVEKQPGDELWAGSFIVGGSGVASIVAVGENTRSAAITKKLRWFDSRLTPLQASLNATIRWLTVIALITGALVYIVGTKNASSLVEILRVMVAGSISLVPEGLVLAATLLFSYGSIRMSRNGVLVRRLGAIEAFGRLEILALDKTGTITDAKLELDRIELLTSGGSLSDVYRGIHALAQGEGESIDQLATLQVLLARVPQNMRKKQLRILAHTAFNSHAKMSSVQYRSQDSKDKVNFILGAPEILLQQVAPAERKEIEKTVQSYAAKGVRVILSLQQKNEESRPKPLALFLMSNALRPGISDTLFYLQANGITLKVISGDSPATVAYIAQKVGIRNADRILTGDQLQAMNAEEWKTLVPATTIFARVLPEQKEVIIATLRKVGFTGMVGDGVNDALAIKKADLGVTVFESSPATRSLADVVLLSNSFSSFPAGVRLGSQIIMGIEMVAAVFFNRIAANLMLLLGSLALAVEYPLTARHLILINFVVVGLPTLLWSLAPVESFGRRNPQTFFRRVLRFAGINGSLTGLAMLLLSYVGAHPTVIVATMYVLGVLTFALIPIALGAIDTPSRRFWQKAYIGFAVLFSVLALLWSDIRSFFNLELPALEDCLVATALVIVVGSVQGMITRYWGRTVRAELLHIAPQLDPLRPVAP